MSADGYLQPPPLAIHRPTRRNTTGSTPKTPVMATPGELESDIQLHAENIRRERMSKRAKQQQEAEAALTREKEKDSTPDVVLVGNLIGEDHVNYVLMYNMLTGIRIGVSSFVYIHSFFH
jgi:1-phosphatidylinositol-4-phosphate 5-kinase